MESVGIAGLGVMGSRVAANLAQAGLLVGVYDRTRSKAQEFAGSHGVDVLDSPESLASRVDVIVTVLSDDTAVAEVLSRVIPVSSGKLIIDMSTISPQVSVELASKARERGGVMYDAPIMGTSVDVEAKRVTVLVGGPKEHFGRVEEILSKTAARVVYVGPNGMGLYMKLAGNMAFAVFLAGLAEAISFASRAGLTPEQVSDLLLNISGTRSPTSGLKVPKMLRSDYEVQFALKHMRKDTEIMVREAQRLKVPLPVTGLASSLLRMAENMGLGDLDVAALIELYRRTSTA